METSLLPTNVIERPDFSPVAEITPTKSVTDPEPEGNFTRNTKVWWQAKTGWSDDVYAYRRNAVYNKIREKWPDEKSLNGRDGRGPQVKQEVKDWLRPLVISFNDHNWPYGATLDRVERQLQPYVSWALYLNRHPPTVASMHMAAAVVAASSATTTPSIPSYSFVYPGQQNVSSSKPKVSRPPAQKDYWSQTSSDEEEDSRPIPVYQARKSQSVVTQSSLDRPAFDWDNVEVQVDARILNHDQVWFPAYDLKPSPKHGSAHWADFRMMDLYNQLSQELNIDIDPSSYQFIFLNQPGHFSFCREGAYRIVLKRFSQTTPADTVLRLRLNRLVSFRAAPSSPVRSAPTQHPVQQTHAANKRPQGLSLNNGRPILTSDLPADHAGHHRIPAITSPSMNQAEQRPSKRTKFSHHQPQQSTNGETSSSTPPSGTSFTAVNTTRDEPAISSPAPPLQIPVSSAKTLPDAPSKSASVEQEQTQSSDEETTQQDTITLIKMEGSG